jgi:allophanate hydrolase subunit 2
MDESALAAQRFLRPTLLGLDPTLAMPGRRDPQSWCDIAQQPLFLLHGSHTPQPDGISQQSRYASRLVISKDGNRTDGRLDGQTLPHHVLLEPVSRSTLPDTVQLLPSGQPIALMAEAPVTSGYPRVGQVAGVNLPRIAQRRTGDIVYFGHVSVETPLTRLAEHKQRLTRLLQRIAQRLQLTD